MIFYRTHLEVFSYLELNAGYYWVSTKGAEGYPLVEYFVIAKTYLRESVVVDEYNDEGRR